MNHIFQLTLCFLCGSAYYIGLDVNLQQIKFVSTHLPPLYIVKYAPYQNYKTTGFLLTGFNT
jgi:hypothetical protein